MTFLLKDRVRETTTTTGTGAFALGGAVAGHRAFNSVLSNLDTTWYACVLPGGAWEVGLGTWVTGNSLQRTTLIDSSTGSAINFAAGTKDIFMAIPASKADARNNSFESGTLMLFQQTAAPVYWTKQVTHNDKALRVVSGTASSGGANAFSTVMAQTTVGNTSLSTAQLAAHTHGVSSTRTVAGDSNNNGGGGGSFAAMSSGTAPTTDSAGSGNSHNHTITMDIQYVDLIIASKDA